LPGLERLLPELADEPVVEANLGEKFDQLHLFDSIRAMLVRLSEGGPVVLILEDLQWIDRSTRDLFAFLRRTLHGQVAMVASYRSDELDRRHPLASLLAELNRQPTVEHLELAPLDRVELAEHLAAIKGAPLPEGATDRIFARSEGNPFYAEELLAAGAYGADPRLPSTLAEVLLTRVEALSRPAQQLLRTTSVAGRRVGHRTLVGVVGWPERELDGYLREAIASRVLMTEASSETYAFRHALLQEAVYGDLLPGERSRLHATYARLLAEADPEGGDGPAAELAWHCLASHDLPSGLAALIRAADHAATVFAPSEAFRHLTQALELWNRVPDAAAVAGLDRVEVLVRAAEAANHSGEFRQAVGLAREALEAIDEQAQPEYAAMAYERLGHYLWDSDFELRPSTRAEVLAACWRAVELVPERPPTPLRARVAAGLARSLLLARDYDGTRRWGDEALAVARAVGSVDDETTALVVLSILELHFGDASTARSLLRDADARAVVARNQSLELEARHALGVFELDLGNLAAACAAFDQATELGERSGLANSVYGIESRVLGCIAHYEAGNWDLAERMAASVDDRNPAAAWLSAVALYLEVGRGRPTAVERLARLSSYRTADPYVAYLAGGCETDLARWQGEPQRSRELATATLAAQEKAGAPWVLSAIWPIALALAAEGDLAGRALAVGDQALLNRHRADADGLLKQARAALQRGRELGRQVGPEALAWLARAEAEWSRVDGTPDPDRWSAAADAFGYGYIYEEARCQWRLGEALLTHGDREHAGEAIRAAYQTAVRLEAQPLLAALEQLARRGRMDLGFGRPSGQATGGLTPRELEVLSLLVEGRSNRQIAEELFISGKTASVHVTRILAKLGVHSRRDAAARARQLGLDHALNSGQP
jgi:DNA-binding CsgD family transcriptional regulator/tetratricopeptide (TPR) repeat protein